jgi:hypothetical protein
MKFQILILITFSLMSCRRNSNASTVSGPADTTTVEHCRDMPADSVFSTGAYLKYVTTRGGTSIEWGDETFRRELDKKYVCGEIPRWLPMIRWSTPGYIGLHYGCGSPCWGTIILPTNKKDSVVERMYEYDVDLVRNEIVYVTSEPGFRGLQIENWVTGKKQKVTPGIDCRPAFLGYCIDSLRLNSGRLFIKWSELDSEGESKRTVIDLIDLQL